MLIYLHCRSKNSPVIHCPGHPDRKRFSAFCVQGGSKWWLCWCQVSFAQCLSRGCHRGGDSLKSAWRIGDDACKLDCRTDFSINFDFWMAAIRRSVHRSPQMDPALDSGAEEATRNAINITSGSRIQFSGSWTVSRTIYDLDFII